MQPLTSDQITTIISGLREICDHHQRMCCLLPDRAEFHQKEYNEAAYLVDYFEKIRDRIFESENFSARISCTL